MQFILFYILEVRHDQYDLASKTWKIYRRYREFYALDECLRSKGYKTPSFPPKNLGTFDPQFVAKRQSLLSAWLENLLNLPAIGQQQTQQKLNPRHSETLRYFISKGANVKPKDIEELMMMVYYMMPMGLKVAMGSLYRFK